MTIKLNLRVVVAVVTVLALLFVLAYLGSPYLAAKGFVDAARSGNRDRIEAAVDFPAVRDSLKSQIAAMMAAKVKSDPSMVNNPFAGLAMLMLPAIVDKAIDMYVTPDGISALVQHRDPSSAGAAPAQTPQTAQESQTRTSTSWITFDRFRVTALGEDRDKDVSLVLERRWLFGWKVVRLELPQGLMNTPSAPASDTTTTTTITTEAPPVAPPAVDATPVAPSTDNTRTETTTTEENTTTTSNSTTPGL